MEKELAITTKLEEINSISQRIVVTVPPGHLGKSIKAALQNLKKDAKVPGFRPGKVPDEMVKKRLGKAYHEEVLRQVVRDTYPEAIRLANAHPISDPRIEVDVMEADEDKPFTYKAVFEIYPALEPADYEGFKLEREKVLVSKEEIEHELVHLQHQMTQLEPAPDAKIEKGILARVDFSGTADGKKFEGCEAKDFIIDVDVGNILPTFENQILGMKDKEERDITFAYPADYFNKEVAGKQGSFHITVKELRRKVVPTLDDAFAKDVGPFKSLDEVRKAIGERIALVKEGQQRAWLHRQVVEQLSKNQPIDVPDVMVSRELGHMLEELAHHLETQGKTLEDAGVNAASFVKEHFEEARLRVRGYVIANAIAEKEGLAVTDAEVGERIAAIAMQTGQQESKVRKHFEDNDLIPGLKAQILMEKALDFVVDKAKIKEKVPKKDKK